MFLDYFDDESKQQFPIALAFALFVYYQLFAMPSYSIKENRPDWYKNAISNNSRLPFWIVFLLTFPISFGIIWTVLYGLISWSIFVYWRDFNSTTSDGYYGIVLLLFLINIILNKLWSPVFFGYRKVVATHTLSTMFGLALGILTAIFGTAVAYVVLVGLDEAWLSFGLWMPYVVWTFIAWIMNLYLLCYAQELATGIRKIRMPGGQYQEIKLA